MLTTSLRRLLLLGFAVAVMQVPVQGQDSTKTLPVVTPLPESAFNVTRTGESCQFAKYSVTTPYPANEVESYIADRLGANGWSRLSLDAFNPNDAPIPSTWNAWKNVVGGEVHTKEEQWGTKNGDVIAYKFWYFAPDMDTLKVDARSCSAASANITKIEPVENGFRVHFRLENTGDEQVYIAALGKWPDGSHHLQSIGVEQEEKGEWGYVGNECVEHVPAFWEILKPGDVIDGWILAVSFTEPNHRFGMCTRRIAALKGPIRVSVGYWRNICEIQNIFEEKNPLPLSASSSSVDLPGQQDR